MHKSKHNKRSTESSKFKQVWISSEDSLNCIGMVGDYARKLYSHLLMREKILTTHTTRVISQNVEREVQHTIALRCVGIEDQNSFCLLNSESSGEVEA